MKIYIINNYKNKYKSLKGKDLTNRIISDCIGKDSSEILREKNGKPYVEGGPHFSVSHTLDTMAVVVSDFNVGLDIQYKKKLDMDKLANRYYREDEIELAQKCEDSFFEIWTKKEAYCKFTGEGLKQIVEKVSVLEIPGIKFKNFKLEGEIYCAVCYEEKNEEQLVWMH